MVLVAERKRAVPLHHKKRTGLHHKRTKRFNNTYRPYLPLLIIVALGFTLNTTWSNSHRNVLGYATDVSAFTLLQKTNAARATNGDTSLAMNDKLAIAAQAKAVDMAKYNYWAHISPKGATPVTFVSQTGYAYAAVGENLAYGFQSSASIITAWMNSNEHRANMLNGSYKDVGFGIVNAKDFMGKGPETIIVAIFATPAGAPVAASSPISSMGSILPARSIARLQILTGNASALLTVTVLLTIIGTITVFFKHGMAWRRTIVHGEAFIMHHYLFDVVVVTIVVIGTIVTRTAGFIH